jgi:SAM-dependent methyltransferase
MLSWYRDQVRQFGLVTATVLLFRVATARILVNLCNKFLRASQSCPCCGWSGRRFYDYIEVGYTVRNAACPECDSHPKHRQYFLWLMREFNLDAKTGVAVICAPERAFNSVWQEAKGLRVFRVDYETTRDVDARIDLQQLALATEAVDFVWCHQVLEHIENDAAAMSELNRILRPGTGELVVSVPMTNSPATVEYGFADPEESGHWRIYGDDFVTKLEASGFEVKKVDFVVPARDAAKFGTSDEPFYLCRKRATG